jgi:hypothetical protein
MELTEIKKNIEDFYKVEVSAKNRHKHYVRAKRIFSYIASEHFNHSVTKIGESMGLKHDSAIYHRDTAKHLIDVGYSDIVSDIYDIFNIDVTVDKTREKREELLKALDLTRLPNKDVNEFVMRVNVMIDAYEKKRSNAI